MIRFALTCAEGHTFESWFRSNADFETLQNAGKVTCSLCGIAEVKKALMAPPLATAERPNLTEPQSPLEREIAALKTEVEKNSHYVGKSFAAEARKMHSGESPARAIHGEAGLSEAKALLEEGIPVLPLPFKTDSKKH